MQVSCQGKYCEINEFVGVSETAYVKLIYMIDMEVIFTDACNDFTPPLFHSYFKFNCLSFLDKFDWAMPIAAAVAVMFPPCLARTAPK
jgi:hypothetical protein